jgi:ATPase subunit of ABC transporter with duplicated ATPase domains
MIMNEETADNGSIKIGETVQIGYVDQRHKEIDPEKSVYEVISGGNEVIQIGGTTINSRAYCSKFNFAGGDQQKKCGVLSGGERNRLHLAMTLKTEANVLLLDEPTNDIDVNTLRALEEGIESFAGCAVVISHDRWFLDRICTHILAFEGDSEVYFFEGRVHGEIALNLAGIHGFGYDPIFIPQRAENDYKSLAELPDWKNDFSHRAKASQSALHFFKESMDKTRKKL